MIIHKTIASCGWQFDILTHKQRGILHEIKDVL